MGRSLFLAIALSGLVAAPAGSGDPGATEPDGTVVLGVAGHSESSRVVTKEWAAVANPRTGAIRKRRLQGGALCHGTVQAVGDRVVYGGSRGRRAVALALPLSLVGAPRSLGVADTFAPSYRHDSLWLGRWRSRGTSARLSLHQVDARGRVLVGARILGSRWSWLYAALSEGFVLTIRDSLVVWDHFRDKAAFAVRGGWFLAASQTRMAWCDEDCRRLHVWSRQGRRKLTPPDGARPLGSPGAFSPDGRLLATGLKVGGRTQVALVDVRSGKWSLVPGSKLAGYQRVAWSPSGRWLYFTDGSEGLQAWRLGAPSATRLPIEPGGTIMSIAVAE